MSPKGQEKSEATQNTKVIKLSWNEGKGCDNFDSWKKNIRSVLLTAHPGPADTFVSGGKYGTVNSTVPKFRMATEEEMKLDRSKRPKKDKDDEKVIIYDQLEYESEKTRHMTTVNIETKQALHFDTCRAAIFEIIILSLSDAAASKVSDQVGWETKNVQHDVDWLWSTIHRVFQTAQTGIASSDQWLALKTLVNTNQMPGETLHAFMTKFDHAWKVVESSTEPGVKIVLPEPVLAAGALHGLAPQYMDLKLTAANNHLSGIGSYPDDRIKVKGLANTWRTSNPHSGQSQTASVAGIALVASMSSGDKRGGKKGKGAKGGEKDSNGGKGNKDTKQGNGKQGKGGNKGNDKSAKKPSDGPILDRNGDPVVCWTCEGNHYASKCPQLKADADEAMGNSKTVKAQNLMITEKGSALMSGRFPPNAVLLDSQAGNNAEICGNPSLLRNIRPLGIDLHIQGVGDDVIKPTLQGDTVYFGAMTLYPPLEFTILSIAKRQKAGQRVVFVNRKGATPGKFILFVNSKTRMEFDETPDGHYMWLAPTVVSEPANFTFAVDDVTTDEDVHALGLPALNGDLASDALVATMSTTRQEREKEFSGTQVAAARRGEELRQKFGGFSDAAITDMLNSGRLVNCNVLPGDLKLAQTIYGPDPAALRGAARHMDAPLYHDMPVDNPPGVEVEMHSDIMFLGQQAKKTDALMSAAQVLQALVFVVTVVTVLNKHSSSNHFNPFTLVTPVASTAATHVVGAIKRQVAKLVGASMKAVRVLFDTDSAITAHESEIQLGLAGLTTVLTIEKEGLVEREIETIKGHASKQYHRIPFALTRLLLVALIVRTVLFLNMMPRARDSPGPTGFERLFGRKVDAERDLKYPFGALVEQLDKRNSGILNIKNWS